MSRLKNYFEKYTRERTKVYIIPSKNGMRFVAINFFLFLIAIAYANNLALLITFLMVTFFVLQMFTIHRIVNMTHLDKIVLGNEFVNFEHFARMSTASPISKELSPFLQISLIDKKNQEIEGIFLKQINPHQIQFNLDITKRGRYDFKRIKIYTYGATKLFYVWRYFPLDQTLFIYPERKNVNTKKLILDNGERANSGEAEFEHHTRYMRGMNSKRIDWKVYAKSHQLFSKIYSDNEATVFDINYHTFTEEQENRLSYMSYLIDKYFHESVPYKVTLPNQIIPAGVGHRHYEESLEAISGF